MTLFGKALIINSLMGSLFVYKMYSCLDLDEQKIKDFNAVIKEFIWKGKKPKIALETLTKSREQGGIRLVDLSVKQEVIQINWIFMLENDLFLSECAYAVLSSKLRNLIWKCNLDVKTIKRMYRDENFWVKILLAWSKINYRPPKCTQSIKDQIIWMNSEILVEGKPIVWDHWIEKDIILIEDLYNNNKELRTPENLGVSWLELMQLCNAIPKVWKEMLHENIIDEDYKGDMYSQLFNKGKR